MAARAGRKLPGQPAAAGAHGHAAGQRRPPESRPRTPHPGQEGEEGAARRRLVGRGAKPTHGSLHFLRCSLCDFFYAAILDGGMPPSVIGVGHVLVESTKVPPV